MANCYIAACNKEATGGFAETIPAPSFEYPNGEADVERFYWCSEHKAEIAVFALDRHGRFLQPDELNSTLHS